MLFFQLSIFQWYASNFPMQKRALNLTHLKFNLAENTIRHMLLKVLQSAYHYFCKLFVACFEFDLMICSLT